MPTHFLYFFRLHFSSHRYYNFASPHTTVYQLWYIREASIAVTVANLICTWQLFQKVFHMRSFDNSRFSINDDAALPAPPGSNRFRGQFRRVVRRVRGSISGIPGLNTATKDQDNGEGVVTGDIELEERGLWGEDE